MNERFLEEAEAQVSRQTEDTVYNVRRAANSRQCDEPWASDFDGEHCIDCEMEIPQARLNYGCVRCTQCEGLKERRR